ncbi:MAG TPA: ABC transporter ATP-binding protein [Galbitalea sp.]|jgi:ABC-type lipoprotein export system ATPase subunit
MTIGTPEVTSPPKDASIVCSDLVRIYSSEGVEVQALQGLNLRVSSGELVAIVGESGSGKSTLLGILSGLDAPTAGSAQVAGRDLTRLSRAARLDYLRYGVGFVWQQTSRNLVPYLSIRENIALPMVLAGLGTSRRAARTAELLTLLEVDALSERRMGQLSGGEQQRAAIAIALANSPAVLLADEPTGELDEASSVDVLESMRRVSNELGVTTLIVTHDSTVSEHVSRTVQIRDGRTSTEVLRRAGTDGIAPNSAESYTVIDAQGRLQLPQDYVARLDLRERVRLALQPDHVGVFPGTEPAGQSTLPEGDSDE